ncbi:MAG: YceI family protein [Bacteroidales bacterium]
MKTKLLLIMLVLSFIMYGYTTSSTKTYKVDKQKTTVIVNGTSNLHDWETNVTNFDGELTAQTNSDNLIEGITLLNVNFYAKSFNSGKSLMDNKTYDALKADTYPLINFTLTSVTDKKLINKVQQFTALGYLTIAGATKPVSLVALSTIGANSEVYFQGTKTIDMTQFGVNPPTALLGTLTTGKDVTITFKLYFS